MTFEELPIMSDDWEVEGQWRRRIQRESTVAELLAIWDIDDELEQSEMAQVLRHLRRTITERDRLRKVMGVLHAEMESALNRTEGQFVHARRWSQIILETLNFDQEKA